MNLRFTQLIQKKKTAETLRLNIKQKKESIATIHRLLEEKRNNLITIKNGKDALLRRLKDGKRRYSQFQRGVDAVGELVDGRLAQCKEACVRIQEKRENLLYLIRYDIATLMKYVFPFSRVVAKSELPDSMGTTETVNALSEATRTAYVRGCWVLQDSCSDLQHVIVAPSLPGNGDYSAYNEWVVTNKDGVPNSSTGTNNTLSNTSTNNAYRISAALTYTCQLVNILAFYMDIKLPYKFFYG